MEENEKKKVTPNDGDERVPWSKSKDLPSRGTLFQSRPDAILFYSTRWILAEFTLFFSPLVTYLLGLALLVPRLGLLSPDQSAIELVYILGYFSLYVGSHNMLLAGALFPEFFHHHHFVSLLVSHRRHRSHFSFMSQRRRAKVCKPSFTVFIMGVLAHSFQVVVTKAWTVQDIFDHLRTLPNLPLVKATKQDKLYFTHNGRRISWTDTMDSLGIGPGSHLFLHLIVPGGGKRSPSSSPSPPHRSKKPKPSGSRRTIVSDSDEDEPNKKPLKRPDLKKPKAPVKGKGGRASHSLRKQREDDAPADLAHASSPPSTLHAMPETPPKKPRGSQSRPQKAAKFTPRTARTVTFSLGRALPSDDEDRNESSNNGSDSGGRKNKKRQRRKRKARPLNKVDHSKAKDWTRLGSSHTTEVYKTFEHWHNDYNIKGYESASDLVEVKLLGHPVDRPKDIRARPFIIQWITPDREAPSEFSDDPRPIFRALYQCNGNCSDLPPSEDDHSDHSESDAPATNPAKETEDVDSDGDSKKRRKRVCPQKVIVHIEVYSDNLSKAVIYRQKTHWETAEKHLRLSEYLRQVIMEYASLANMTAGRIKRRLLQAYKEQITPLYRRPTAVQVENIVTNIRRNERLDNDPLQSIGIFAEKHPDKIFGYRPVDMSTNPPSKFATGIKSIHALQSILLWAFINGIGLDSCWRHKNENRAPVTFITTIDQNNRMLPGPVHLSANVTAETLEVFLRDVKGLVEDMARDLLTGDIQVHPSHARFERQLMEAAGRVRDNSWNWIPLYVMIDKSTAEMNAISRVWPTTDVRLCQFHVIQAILRWDRDHDTGATRPKLSRSSRDKLLHAVRDLQRCRSEDEWAAAVEKFRNRIASFTDASSTAAIMQYFERNWFIPLWRDSWTDIGLPHGRNRDTISTNNWTERAFKTFDQIFLENRANKSAYRLVMIIANEWFSYYENWQLDTVKVDRSQFKIAERGHRLWNSGSAIIAMPPNSSGQLTWKVANIRTMARS